MKNSRKPPPGAPLIPVPLASGPLKLLIARHEIRNSSGYRPWRAPMLLSCSIQSTHRAAQRHAGHLEGEHRAGHCAKTFDVVVLNVTAIAAARLSQRGDVVDVHVQPLVHRVGRD